ncbi:hypothetical protein D9756_010715 [Leucocoprinus leucothites]|uniref:Uncharacterized protein n=1 Tax=Leucocoprinus leucothites TaxID=201217 RepID=A0A8H5FSZ5_9AGAR|nr:hypothetical protein D9756_010715 [Leucoagaricus leucothites]
MLEHLEEASERGEVFRTGMKLAADRAVVRKGGEVRRAVDDDSEKITAPQHRQFNTQPQDLPSELLESGRRCCKSELSTWYWGIFIEPVKTDSQHCKEYPVLLRRLRSPAASADYWAVYTDRLLPSQQVASPPEIIRRLGAISVNTSLEVNIYGSCSRIEMPNDMKISRVNYLRGSSSSILTLSVYR